MMVGEADIWIERAVEIRKEGWHLGLQAARRIRFVRARIGLFVIVVAIVPSFLFSTRRYKEPLGRGEGSLACLLEAVEKGSRVGLKLCELLLTRDQRRLPESIAQIRELACEERILINRSIDF